MWDMWLLSIVAVVAFILLILALRPYPDSGNLHGSPEKPESTLDSTL